MEWTGMEVRSGISIGLEWPTRHTAEGQTFLLLEEEEDESQLRTRSYLPGLDGT